MDKKVIYTVGYTLFDRNPYIGVNELLTTMHKFNIGYLIDVRSVPFSGQFPQYNADQLKQACRQYSANHVDASGEQYKLKYAHMQELGAKARSDLDVFSKASDIFFEPAAFPVPKSNRPDHFELNEYDEIVDFRKFRNEEYFHEGLSRIKKAYSLDCTLCLMCSEKLPRDCHRYFLICHALTEMFGDWLEIKHIVKKPDGTIALASQRTIDEDLKNEICNKKVVKDSIFKNKPITTSSSNGLGFDLLPSDEDLLSKKILDKYVGNSEQEQIDDFCDRFWNLYHGWRKNALLDVK